MPSHPRTTRALRQSHASPRRAFDGRRSKIEALVSHGIPHAHRGIVRITVEADP